MFFLKKIIKTLGYKINKFTLTRLENNIYFNNVLNLKNIVLFLKNDTNNLFKSLTDIVVIDYPSKKNRFEIIYLLLSYTYNQRITVRIFSNEVLMIESLTVLYTSANWAEREVWDMYGVFFKNHPDLRRILTDYGFEGFPLRKDFPLSGYKEVFYNDVLKTIQTIPVVLFQEYRTFEKYNSWV